MPGAACDSDPLGHQAPCLPPTQESRMQSPSHCPLPALFPWPLASSLPGPLHLACITQAEAAAASGGTRQRRGCFSHPSLLPGRRRAVPGGPHPLPDASQNSVPTNELVLAKHTISVKRPSFVACRYDGSRSEDAASGGLDSVLAKRLGRFSACREFLFL